MKKLFFFLFAMAALSMKAQSTMPIIDIVYSGSSAEVRIPEYVKDVYLNSASGSSFVSIYAANTNLEYCYRVSGQSDNGSLSIQGNYKLTLELAGVSLTSRAVGATGAITIDNGKRVAVRLAEGTVNTLADNSVGSQKAALYFTGHPEFEGGGTLNVTGNLAHAISAKEYLELKEDVGAINILSAKKDGIHCGKGKVGNANNYFEMKGGAVNISNVGSDCIDSDDFGCMKIKGGTLTLSVSTTGGSALKCDSIFTMRDGDVNIMLLAPDAEGVRCNYQANFNGGHIRGVNAGDGSKAIKLKKESVGTVIGGGNAFFNGTDVEITISGSTLVTATDASRCMGVSVDGNMSVTDGDIILHRQNDQAKSHNVKGMLAVSDGGRIILDGTHYTPKTAYQHDMTVYAKAKVKGQTDVDYANYHLAAYVGKECRGTGDIFLVRDGYAYICFRVFGQDGETVNYRLYDASEDSELLSLDSHPLSAGTTLSVPSNPFLLRFNEKGDVNADGNVTLSDLAALVSLLGGSKEASYDQGAADMDDNGRLDLNDAKQLTNKLLIKK